jgi:hypothetical protein
MSRSHARERGDRDHDDAGGSRGLLHARLHGRRTRERLLLALFRREPRKTVHAEHRQLPGPRERRSDREVHRALAQCAEFAKRVARRQDRAWVLHDLEAARGAFVQQCRPSLACLAERERGTDGGAQAQLQLILRDGIGRGDRKRRLQLILRDGIGRGDRKRRQDEPAAIHRPSVATSAERLAFALRHFEPVASSLCARGHRV